MSGFKGRTIAALIYLTVVAVIFSGPLVRLFTYAWHSDVNSYVVLVPFVCGYLLAIRKASLPTSFRPAISIGIGLAVTAAIVWVIAISFPHASWMQEKSDQLTLLTLAFVLAVWAGGFFFFGRAWMAAAMFPMAFLIFTVPLPSGLVDILESASKVASAEAASWFFALTGTPTLRDGNVFQLPNITIEVAQECSGIRSSYVLVLTSLVAGNLFLRRNWSRILLVLFVVPLGIIRNGFRVWVIATLCINVGPQMIHSIIHRRGGPVFFVISLVPMLFLVWWFRRLEARGLGRAPQHSRKIRSVEPIPTPNMASVSGDAPSKGS